MTVREEGTVCNTYPLLAYIWLHPILIQAPCNNDCRYKLQNPHSVAELCNCGRKREEKREVGKRERGRENEKGRIIDE